MSGGEDQTENRWFWWLMGIVGAVIGGLILATISGGGPDDSPSVNTTAPPRPAVDVSITGPTEWTVGGGTFSLFGTVSGQTQSVFWTDGLGVDTEWNGGRIDLHCPAPGVYTIGLTAIGLDADDHRARHSVTCR